MPDRESLYERWLESGWSLLRSGAWVVAAVTTVVSVWGYLTHRGHPGAVWWIVGGLAVIVLWALSETRRAQVRLHRIHSGHTILEPHATAIRERDEAVTELARLKEADVRPEHFSELKGLVNQLRRAVEGNNMSPLGLQ